MSKSQQQVPMNFMLDQSYVDALARELHAGWAQKRIHRVDRLGRDVLALSIRSESGQRPELIFAAWPGEPHMFVADSRFSLPLVERIRDRALGPPLEGSKIIAICSTKGMRTLRFEIASRTLGEVTLELVAAGQAANVCLRAAEISLVNMRPHHPRQKKRQEAPPADTNATLLDLLVARWPALSPLLIREALHRSRLSPSDPAESPLRAELVDLLNEFTQTVEQQANGLVYRAARGRLYWSPVALEHLRGSVPGPWIEPLANGKEAKPMTARLAGSLFSAPTLLRRSYDLTRRNLLQQALQEEKRLRRRLRHLNADLARADSAARLRADGNAILASLHLLRRGLTKAEVPDPTGGGTRQIDLDPRRSPSANADDLFRRARKADDSRRHVEQRLEATKAELGAVRARLAGIEAAETAEQLAAIAGIGGRIGGSAPAKTAVEKVGKRQKLRDNGKPGEDDPRWRRYLLPGDWVVLAARNAKDNDILTQRVAHLSDLWFHARGCPGSHVVLRCAQRKDQPPKAVLEATAAIAAYHSKARNSGLVPVAYAPKRYVRKPKGAKAGLVFMNREVVVFVKPRLPKGYRH